MNENPKEAGKLSRFFEEKGFYIILFLCVIAIGIAGYVLFLSPGSAPDEIPAAYTNADLSPSYLPPSAGVSNGGMPDVIDTAGEKDPCCYDGCCGGACDGKSCPACCVPEDDKSASLLPADPDAVVKEAASKLSQDEPAETVSGSVREAARRDTEPSFFVRPVTGGVIREFSYDELVYNRTMGDWRTHNGVDFSAVSGELVAAIADGVIADIYTDEFYGTSVLIDHGGGLRSVYLGLIDNATVTKGQKVTAGDIIGAVGAASLFEALEPVHLHIEVTKDGVRVNPLDYIPT